MIGVDNWIEMARTARTEGRFEDAAELYEYVATRCEEAVAPRKAGHARRHAAELLLKAGKVTDARIAIVRVMNVYHDAEDIPALERANALRVLALVEELVPAPAKAREAWAEARSLYFAEGVKAGVEEAELRMTLLGLD